MNKCEVCEKEIPKHKHNAIYCTKCSNRRGRIVSGLATSRKIGNKEKIESREKEMQVFTESK